MAIDGLAIDAFHREVLPALLRRPTVDEPRDVGMLQVCQDLALGLEALDHELRAGPFPAQLDRHLLLVLVVIPDRPVDRPHASVADLAQHAIRPDVTADAARPRRAPSEALQSALDDAAQ